MTNFDLSGLPDPPSPPPIDLRVAREEKIANDTRVESELNKFIAAKQDALFEAPDAYFRRQGRDAVDGAPQAVQRLHGIKEGLLDGLANDYQRKRLSTALDAQMTLASDDIARHAGEQSKVWQRRVALDRIDLLAKEAALHHSDDALIDGAAIAAANAARAHARVDGSEIDSDRENEAAATARSRVLSAAIQSRLDNGKASDAAALLDRTKELLDPAHATPLVVQLQSEPPPRDGDGKRWILVGPQLIVEGGAADTPDENAEGPEAQPEKPQPERPQPEEAQPRDPQPKEAPPEETPPEEPQPGEIQPPELWPEIKARPQEVQPDEPQDPIEPRRPPNFIAGQGASSAAEPPGRQLVSAIAASASRMPVPGVGIGGELARAVSRLAPVVKGAGLLTAADILFLPWNSQGRTMDLGDDLRARWAPGERLIKIERRVDNGLFGSGVGATWEELPVEATFEPDEHGRQILRVDADALKRALATAAKTQASGMSISAPFEALPPSKAVIYEIRIGASVDGGTTMGFREATHEEIERLCPNYPMIQGVGLRAAAEIEGMGARRGQMVHKLAENQLKELKVARSAEILREMGIVELRPEIALRNGKNLSFYRAKGSSVLDVLEVYGNGGEKRACVYDFKTGTAVLPDATAVRYGHEVGNYVQKKYKVMPVHITVVPVHLP